MTGHVPIRLRILGAAALEAALEAALDAAGGAVDDAAARGSGGDAGGDARGDARGGAGGPCAAAATGPTGPTIPTTGNALVPAPVARGASASDRAAPVRLVLLRRDASPAARAAADRAASAGARVLEVNAPEIGRLVGGGGMDEVLAFAGPPPDAPIELAMREDGPAWLFAGVAFPGNVGLAIRTAEVSGAALAAVAPPLVGEERRGALRASIGADRFFPVFWTDADLVVAAARASGRRVIALETTGDRAPWDCDLTTPALFVIGGERAGVPPSVLAAADAVLRLPTAGVIPSYNVQAAMAAVALERMRQTGTW